MGKNGHAPEPEWESDFREHFLYFPERAGAEVAAERLRAKGWTVEVGRSAADEDWLVLATDHFPKDDNLYTEWEELEQMAEELGGRYDGHGGPA